MKLKLSAGELRRLAELLTDSVARGASGDVALRDRVLEQVRQHTETREAEAARRRGIKERAAAVFRNTFQRVGHPKS